MPREHHWDMDDQHQWILPERIEHFIDWLVDPNKQPKSMRQYAKEVGWSYVAVRRWRQDPRVQREVDKRLRELNVSPERTQEVIDALHRQAVKGDTNAARLYLQYIDQFSPKQTVVIEDKRISDLSDEEFQAELAKVLGSE